MLALATIVVSVVALGYASLRFYRAVELLKIRTTEGVNDHDRARAAFRELLDEADSGMIEVIRKLAAAMGFPIEELVTGGH